jgi:glucose/arabinose dehydrogenase
MTTHRSRTSVRPTLRGGATLPVLALAAAFGGAFSVIPGGLSAQQEPILRGELPSMPEVRYLPSPPGLETTTFASGLEVIWALDFASDGRLFLTERPGRIRVVGAGGTLEPQPWATLDVVHEGESGLMGLALHPNFPTEPWVYVMYTARTPDGMENRVSRIREVGGRGGEEEILLGGIPVAGNHSGGTLRFGPDGMLYIAAGDTFDRDRATNLDDLAGSVLRLTPQGAVPPDNPFPGNPIWAYGVRNPHGLDFQPGTGQLFAADHGPSGEDGARAHDRLIILEAGRHHGWPAVIGAAGDARYVDPFLTFVPASPPGDLRFYDADLMPELRGDLFVSVLGFTPVGAQNLMRVRFQDPADPLRVTAIERWFNDEAGNPVYGRLRGLAVGPDGALYVGTSNRDGRSFGRTPDPQDDRILRIAPAGR